MLILFLIRLAEQLTEKYEDLYMLSEDEPTKLNRLKFWAIALIDTQFIKLTGLRYDYDEGIYLCRPERDSLDQDYQDIGHYYYNFESYHKGLKLSIAKDSVWTDMTINPPQVSHALDIVREYQRSV